jgi:hypothetical protein
VFKSITDIPDRTKAEKLNAVFAAILNDRKLRIKINVLKTARNFGCRYESLRDRLNSAILKAAKGVRR